MFCNEILQVCQVTLMEMNASGYSVTSAKKRHHTLIAYQTFIECFSHLTQTRKMNICVLPAGILKVK